MSYGYTGLIVRVAAYRCGKSVDFVVYQSFDYRDNTTGAEESLRTTHNFKSTFRAMLFTHRIDIGQHQRYKNLRYR